MLFFLSTELLTTSWRSHLCHISVSPALLCSSQAQKRRGGDVLASARCHCELSQGLSVSGRLSSGRNYQPTVRKRQRDKWPKFSSRHVALLHPLCFPSHVSWPSPCQKSWRPGGSSRRLRLTPSGAAGRRWRWTSTAPTQRRPSPSTTSTRGASSRHTSTCE